MSSSTFFKSGLKRLPSATYLYQFIGQQAGLKALASILLLGTTAAGCTDSNQGLAETSYERRLVDYLISQNATMYGAYWCPYSSSQKKLFGRAVDHVQYVECDPAGRNAQTQLCQVKNIQGYPTWEIHGQFYPGVKSLETLAELSGFHE